MTTLATDTENWIDSVCRRFSDATGWPLEYTPVQPDEAAAVEAGLRDNPDCCWFSRIDDGDQPTGYLHVGLPRGSDVDPAFPAASDLAEIFAQLLCRLCAAGRSLESRTEEVSTLVDIGLSIPNEENVLGALNQLLRAAVQVTGFRAAGFFLLNPSTNELSLRAVHHLEPEQIPFARRELTENPPDLEALTKGRVLLQRYKSPEQARWLPEDASTALCVAVQSEMGPIGSLWAFDRRGRAPAEQDCHVLESIAAQIAVVLERVVLLQESETGHRLQRDLQVASESQTADILREVRSDAKFDAAAVCASHFEVGGDLCELIPIDEHRTIIAVGDASGDSIPAALIMSAVQGSLRSIPVKIVDGTMRTDLVVHQINQVLHSVTPPHQFMSLLYGVLDTRNDTFTYTNAGHPSPLLVHAGRTSVLESHGMLLGVVDDASYDQSVISLSAGDILVGFTDGISEALSPTKQLFRVAGIVSAIEGRSSESAEGILQAIWQEMESHTAGGSEPDDRTLLVMRIK